MGPYWAGQYPPYPAIYPVGPGVGGRRGEDILVEEGVASESITLTSLREM